MLLPRGEAISPGFLPMLLPGMPRFAPAVLALMLLLVAGSDARFAAGLLLDRMPEPLGTAADAALGASTSGCSGGAMLTCCCAPGRDGRACCLLLLPAEGSTGEHHTVGTGQGGSRPELA
jgi:hypothetical protein